MSEVFDVREFVSTNGTAEGILLAVCWVLDLKRTLGPSAALRKFVLGVSRHIVAFDLSCVAGLTEVSVAPAEPLGN